SGPPALLSPLTPSLLSRAGSFTGFASVPSVSVSESAESESESGSGSGSMSPEPEVTTVPPALDPTNTVLEQPNPNTLLEQANTSTLLEVSTPDPFLRESFSTGRSRTQERVRAPQLQPQGESQQLQQSGEGGREGDDGGREGDEGGREGVDGVPAPERPQEERNVETQTQTQMQTQTRQRAEDGGREIRQRKGNARRVRERYHPLPLRPSSPSSPRPRPWPGLGLRTSTRRGPPSTSALASARTEDELVRRLEETQSAHRHRWAPNSFLDVWRAHVRRRGGRVGAVEALEVASTSTHTLTHTSAAHTLAAAYTLLLVLNPAVDATAIWVQTKFGVPASGWWRSAETEDDGDMDMHSEVFEIPFLPHTPRTPRTPSSPSTPTHTPPTLPTPTPPTPCTPTSPGLIIFELTPLAGIRDALERKYVVLRDCTRLRGVLEGVSRRGEGRRGEEEEEDEDGDEDEEEGEEFREEEREEEEGEEFRKEKREVKWFVPSLMLIHWAENEGEAIPKDVGDLISRYTPGTIAASSVLSLTSTATDLDARFDRALAALRAMDVDGARVRVVEGVQGLFKLLQPAFDAFLLEWLDNCAVGPGLELGVHPLSLSVSLNLSVNLNLSPSSLSLNLSVITSGTRHRR
ncbi:hypothetical protein EV368DRAFT_70314, partial [Lentinula lateritia]